MAQVTFNTADELLDILSTQQIELLIRAYVTHTIMFMETKPGHVVFMWSPYSQEMTWTVNSHTPDDTKARGAVLRVAAQELDRRIHADTTNTLLMLEGSAIS